MEEGNSRGDIETVMGIYLLLKLAFDIFRVTNDIKAG
jgi:hypothetical protein